MYTNNPLKFDLSQARERKVVEAMGYRVQYSATEDTAAIITVWLKHDNSGTLSGPFPLRKGDVIEVPQLIEQVLVSNEATAGEAVINVVNMARANAPTKFEWKQEEFGNINSIVNAIKNKSGNNINTPPPVDVGTSATLIAAANTDVNFREFQNHGSTDVWLGDANVSHTSNRAILVKPGGSYEINSGGAMYGIRASGSGDVAIVEVE